MLTLGLFFFEYDVTYPTPTVSEQTKIPLTTFYSWREKVRAHPDWPPSSEHFSTNPRTFPSEVETMLADFIRLHFASEGQVLTGPTLRPLLLMIVHDLIAEGVLEQQALDFKASYHFTSGFLRRLALSFRRARAQRRFLLDQDECAHFMANVIAAYHRRPPS
jgi:hypothetical protein